MNLSAHPYHAHPHHAHPHHAHTHDHHHNITTDGECSPLTTCMTNNDCVMSRLSPYDDGHGAVPFHQEACTPFSAMESIAPFHPDSKIHAGLEHSPCLLPPYSRVIHSPCLQLDGLRYESSGGRLDPHSPVCMVPLPEHFADPSFIRRRNERERERVRCVNDGYDRLKDHLPLADRDRRLSKVETLRGAIKYIRQLKRLLQDSDEGQGSRESSANSVNHKNKRCHLSLGRKHRSWSLSSSDQESSLSDS